MILPPISTTFRSLSRYCAMSDARQRDRDCHDDSDDIASTEQDDSPITPKALTFSTAPPRTRSGSSPSAHSLFAGGSGAYAWSGRVTVSALTMKADLAMEPAPIVSPVQSVAAPAPVSPKMDIESALPSPKNNTSTPGASSSRSSPSFQGYTYSGMSTSRGMPSLAPKYRRQSRFDPMGRDEEDMEDDGYEDLGHRHPLRRVQEEGKEEAVSLPSIRNLFSVAGEYRLSDSH